jgi:hypothetical protein
VADFVAPTKELRAIYQPEYAIWMDTIKEGRFEDTNKVWQSPSEDEYHYKVSEFIPVEEEVQKLCNLILNQTRG